MLVFGLTASDNIAFVGPGWDSFALRNGGARATTARVIGRSLWEGVDGTATRGFLEPLLDDIRRTGRPATLVYRCDSPAEERLFCQYIRPTGHGELRLHNRLVRIRPQARLLATAAASAAGLRQCSICLAVTRDGRWWTRLTRAAHPFATPAAWTVCPTCRSGAVTRHTAGSALVPA